MQWKDAPQTLGSSENFFLTPIFIQNFNQLSYLRKLLNWLLAAGYKNICIIDNNSTYAPLLQFYTDVESSLEITVLRRKENGSKTTLWEGQFLERFGVTGPFVYTDSDIVPDEACPIDVVGRLASLLRDHPQIFKAGPGLRIDNLPTSYRFCQEVTAWEKQFWMAPVCRGAFLSAIDTAFALYRPNSTFALRPALRTGWPYLARHETWYQDSENLSEEQRYYALEVEKTLRSHWARRQLPQWLEVEAAKRTNSNLKLLHLGCGHEVMPGWINLDRNPTVAADIVFDLENCAERKLPMAADSIDGLFMCHAFQKIDAILPMMQELHRVAKADARFVIRLAHGASDEAFADPAHKRPYFPTSFVHYAQPAHADTNNDYSGDWRVQRVKLVVDQKLLESEGELKILERIRRERNVVEEMIVELRAVKPPRPRRQGLLECPVPAISGTRFDAESDFQNCSPG
jgi:SAM-dependent methyltransferase